MSKVSKLEAQFIRMWDMYSQSCTEPMVTEYRFAPPRMWRFDFAFPSVQVAVEIEGAIWTGGRHTRGGGYEKDTEKYNAAVMEGWRVLRYSGGMLSKDPQGVINEVLELIELSKPS